MTIHAAIRLDRHSPSTSIVSLDGTFGRGARQELANALAQAGDCEALVIDLTRAEHVDPSLVNVVQQTAERLLGTSARLGIIIPASAHALRSLFETVGSTSITPVHETRAAALAALARRTAARVGRAA